MTFPLTAHDWPVRRATQRSATIYAIMCMRLPEKCARPMMRNIAWPQCGSTICLIFKFMRNFTCSHYANETNVLRNFWARVGAHMQYSHGGYLLIISAGRAIAMAGVGGCKRQAVPVRNKSGSAAILCIDVKQWIVIVITAVVAIIVAFSWW